MRDLQPTSYKMGKTESFPTKIRSKTRMSAFTTPIQHSIRSPSHSNQTRKGSEEAKFSLFANDMIVYIENPVNSTKKLLDLINEFGKTAGYKVNTQKSKAFLYTNNETAEREIRKNILFDIATRKI